ncbi:MAG: SRPBCC family protein [Methylomonas sp.]
MFLLAICFPVAAHGAQVLISSATHENERYILHTETIVSVPVQKVRSLILDYKNFPRLNADIKRVEAMGRLDDGGIRMGVRSSVCILSICQHFEWVQDIRILPDGDIIMTIVPGHGDFRRGNGRWRLFPTDGGTRLIFDLDLTPKGWVPPIFGPWVMERKLTENAFEFAHGLETMANSN